MATGMSGATSETVQARQRVMRIGVAGTARSVAHYAQVFEGSAHGVVVGMCATPERGAAELAAVTAGDAVQVSSFAELLHLDLDGIIISSATSHHVEQARTAVARGLAVFCQRPVGCNAEDTSRIISAAKQADVLLGVDLALRCTEAMRVLRSTVQAGELGDIYAADVLYHDAHGPGNGWGLDATLSGGGCVLDVGYDVLDLALWTLGFPRVTSVSSRMYARGEPVFPNGGAVAEDYATALIELDTGVALHFASSWMLSVGQSARIEATFYGTEGSASFRNMNGNTSDFIAELFRGTHRHVLATTPDARNGRAAAIWCDALARGQRYDPWVEGVADVAALVDRVRGTI